MHLEVHECLSKKNNSQISLKLGKVESRLRCSQLSLEHLIKDKKNKLFVKTIFLCFWLIVALILLSCCQCN